MAPCWHPLRHRNTAFRSTVSMFWGWAQADPAGIHASSAPVHGRWARRRPTNTWTHLVINAKPNANPDAFRLQEHRVHVLGLGYVDAVSFIFNKTDLPPQRKLTLRGFTHPQLQYMDAGPVDALQTLGLTS
ncbi:hypothetical protein DFP72DRAFT_1078875 [Ephemerocybe angulata]|uniref:Uncharacterized protein n=1 Tax=Ephemerocybe angulata TaxID=980116 RepID=A0A8H6LW39_9AGAR|nr:hypothetical protein DFP72DRAFT_1078875 [Tulosesus angulatus]